MGTDISTIERLPFIVGDRVRILLTYRGIKPASFVDLFDSNWNTDIPDSYNLPEEVESGLENDLARMGLHCLRRDRAIPLGDDEVFMQRSLYFGRDEGSLKKLLSAQTDCDFGVAFGLPDTAIEAYIGKRERFNGRFPEDVSVDAIRFSEFVKSADNWREELKTSQQWADVTRLNSRYLYQTYMRQSLIRN